MTLTPAQEFKLGFLSRCVSEGLDEPQMLKAAAAANELLKTAFIDSLIGAARSGIGTMASYGLPVALLAPPLIGGAAGYGLAKATDIGDRDVDDIKNDELIDELDRQAEKLKQHRTQRDANSVPSRATRPLM